jgi:hypothetical protein
MAAAESNVGIAVPYLDAQGKQKAAYYQYSLPGRPSTTYPWELVYTTMNLTDGFDDYDVESLDMDDYSSQSTTVFLLKSRASEARIVRVLLRNYEQGTPRFVERWFTILPQPNSVTFGPLTSTMSNLWIREQIADVIDRVFFRYFEFGNVYITERSNATVPTNDPDNFASTGLQACAPNSFDATPDFSLTLHL